MEKYLFLFSPKLLDFCIAEFESLLLLFLSEKPFIDKSDFSIRNPILCIECNRKTVEFILSRSIMIKKAFLVYREEKTVTELLENLKNVSFKEDSFSETQSFCLLIESPCLEKTENLIENFGFLLEQKKISLDNADNVLTLVLGNKKYFCLFVGKSIRKKDLQKYDLKKRRYIGTTSMDAELSLVMANISLSCPGKLFYDPFSGTGSIVCAVCSRGGYCIGSDIDGRQIRGNIVVRGIKNEKKTSSLSNLEDYFLEKKSLGFFVFDITKSPWRKEMLFDGIITDPPYGIRTGTKKTKELTLKLEKSSAEELIQSLLHFSAVHLKKKGRLIFWFYRKKELPKFITPELSLLYVCSQKLGIDRGRDLYVFERI